MYLKITLFTNTFLNLSELIFGRLAESQFKSVEVELRWSRLFPPSLPCRGQGIGKQRGTISSWHKRSASRNLVVHRHGTTLRQIVQEVPLSEFRLTAVLPYVQGVSEPLRRCVEQQGIRTVFKSETTLRSNLVRPKDSVDAAKQDGARGLQDSL